MIPCDVNSLIFRNWQDETMEKILPPQESLGNTPMNSRQRYRITGWNSINFVYKLE